MTLPTTKIACLAALTPLLVPALRAQIPLSGALSGTLAPAVYHATSNLSVAVGQTLTLSAGVIIKFSGTEITVGGTLIANGTAGNRVIFTSLNDDSAGGDTNGNGPSVGSPTEWRGIVFAATASASSLNQTEIRYGGSGFVSNLELTGCNATFTNCVVRHNYTHGMDLNGTSRPTVSGCSFTNNGGFAVEGVPIAALAGFASNTAAGNAAGNFANVTDGAVDAALTLGPAAMISGAIVVSTDVAIAAATTLTLQAGVNVKFRSAQQIVVSGTLRANGTAGAPVVFTALADDSAGGDTNGNGASSGAPTAWRGIVFQPTAGASSLTRADVRYGGSGFVSNLELNGCNPTFTDCVVRDCYTHGMDLNAISAPTVTRCVFTGNGGFAIEAASMSALPGLVDNTASGNAGGNYARVTAGGVTGNLTVGPRAMISGAVVIDTPIAVPAGASLTLAAGLNLKFRSAERIDVDGTLLANGTAGGPVVFTALADDSAGGDTNANGPSAGAPTAWRGIVFHSGSSASTLDWADVRYGGSAFVSNVELDGANPTLRHCVIRDCYTHGMDLNANSRPRVSDCTFTGNGGYAVENAAIDAVPGFANNSASGNGGSYIRITSGNVAAPLTIGPQSVMNGGLVLATTVAVAASGRLTVEQGTIFKFQSALEITVDGAIDLRGTGYEPVVFTALADDEFGGDTNGNGPSTGGPTAWRGINCSATAGPSRFENVIVRFTGSGFAPGVANASPNVAMRSVRVDRGYSNGFVLSALAGTAHNLVAWGCGGHGIHLTGGNFGVAHATSVANGTGFRNDGWTGAVVNSIAWANSSNFGNFGAAQVVRCDGGFAGSNGNIDTDPLFSNQTAGDLHLQPTSPCLNAADLGFAVATAKDFDENSRVLDHALNGAALPDMGAFERAAWDMVMTGIARPGAVPTLTITGPAGFSFWVLGALDGTFPVQPYGMLLAGLPGASVALLVAQPVPTGFTLPFVLANDPNLIGATAGIQTLTFPTSGLATGNFTRLLRALVRP